MSDLEMKNLDKKFVELCFVSPDWKISEDKDLQEIIVQLLADWLEIENPPVVLEMAFRWVEDDIQHKHLFVDSTFIPAGRSSKKHIDDTKLYALGLSTGMGYI